MREGRRIGVVIPARDEEKAIARVVAAIPTWVDCIIVADNGSTDGTAAAARAAGAKVVSEPDAGYGAACLAGIEALPDVDIVAFIDGDNSDFPEDMADLVDPIITGSAELVIGSRVLGQVEAGALTPQQRWGNWLATRLLGLFWGVRFTDLGPFRAISSEALSRLAMADRTYGWTVEMQIKAAELDLKFVEVPVRYRRRIGVSKISGTIRGVALAGAKILSMIAWRAFAKLLRGRGSA